MAMSGRAPHFDVYLSGPVSSYGKITDNIKAFNKAAKELRAKGLRVFSPVEGEARGLAWSQYLRDDIKHMMDCEAIALMPNWNKSKGARLEKRIMDALGAQSYKVEELLNG